MAMKLFQADKQLVETQALALQKQEQILEGFCLRSAA